MAHEPKVPHGLQTQVQFYTHSLAEQNCFRLISNLSILFLVTLETENMTIPYCRIISRDMVNKFLDSILNNPT